MMGTPIDDAEVLAAPTHMNATAAANNNDLIMRLV